LLHKEKSLFCQYEEKGPVLYQTLNRSVEKRHKKPAKKKIKGGGKPDPIKKGNGFGKLTMERAPLIFREEMERRMATCEITVTMEIGSWERASDWWNLH